MRVEKLTTLSEAIATHVSDGMVVALEGFGHLIPFAAGHEIIRQRRRDLTVCRMTPDIITDQLLAAGCVTKLVASFFASGSAGSLYEIRRRVENHDPEPLDVEEYSHYGMYCRYQAGAASLPFFPLRSYVGSDLPQLNPRIKTVESPFGDGTVHVVPPLNPDVTIIHAQRADVFGNVQIWGISGAQQEAAYAAERVVVTVEDVVDPAVIRADPNRTLIPAHAVDAVVHVPRGAHPSYAQGHYDRDSAFYREWTPISRERQRIREWIDEWIYGTSDHEQYIAKIGAERWARLDVSSAPSGSIDYGRRGRVR